MIKLIATDMDGTLLDSNNKINPEFYEVFEKLKEKNIFARYFNQPLIDNYLRITIGTDEQMEKLYAALEEITGQVK